MESNLVNLFVCFFDENFQGCKALLYISLPRDGCPARDCQRTMILKFPALGNTLCGKLKFIQAVAGTFLPPSKPDCLIA